MGKGDNAGKDYFLLLSQFYGTTTDKSYCQINIQVYSENALNLEKS